MSDKMREALEAWFGEQIADAKERQTEGFRRNQIAGERGHARHCALFEAKQAVLAALQAPPSQPTLATSIVTEDDGSGDLISPDSEAAARIYDPAFIAGWKAARSRPVTAGADDSRVYFICQSCETENPEGAVSCRADIAVMPDGTWLCDGCYSDCDKTAYGLVANDIDDFEFPRFEDLPRPTAYPADPAVSPQDGAVGSQPQLQIRPLAWRSREIGTSATGWRAHSDDPRPSQKAYSSVEHEVQSLGPFITDQMAQEAADWILGYLEAECSLSPGTVSSSDRKSIVNCIRNLAASDAEAPSLPRADGGAK